MKTAISMPDDTFDRASARAKTLGISRSEFFATAALHYLDELDTNSLTEQVNAALTGPTPSDDSSRDAVTHGHHALARLDDEEW